MNSDEVLEALSQKPMRKALREELRRTRKLEPGRLWRIAMLTSPDDDVRSVIFPAKFVIIGSQPRGREQTLQEIAGPGLAFGPTEGAQDMLEAAAEAVAEHVWERKALRTARAGWLCQHRVRLHARHDDLVDVPDGIEVEDTEVVGQFVPLQEFLAGEGFPQTVESTGSVGLYSMEVTGLAMRRGSKIHLIREPYFARRSLVNDWGDLVYLGLDEGIVSTGGVPGHVEYNWRWAPFPVRFQPWTGEVLSKYTETSLLHTRYKHYQPLFRYSCLPIPYKTKLPLIDAPLSSALWADVFVQPSGEADVYLPRDGAEFPEMLRLLVRLWHEQLGRYAFHLAEFTKDADRVETYLESKLRIVQDYFDVIHVEI